MNPTEYEHEHNKLWTNQNMYPTEYAPKKYESNWIKNRQTQQNMNQKEFELNGIWTQ